MPDIKITKKAVDALPVLNRRTYYWDNQPVGFGVVVHPSGAKVYLVQYREGKGRAANARRITIGRHGSPWTPETARNEAIRILRDEKGLEPQKSLTVEQLCALYLRDGIAKKKETTIQTDRGRIARHIIPLLGKTPVDELRREHVEQMLLDIANGKTKADEKTGRYGRSIVRGGNGTATRTVGLFGGILSFAVRRGLLTNNPALGVSRYPDRNRGVALNYEQSARLLRAIGAQVELGSNRMAADILKLLLFTGCRSSEITSLLWDEVDLPNATLRLKDSKTGKRLIILSKRAISILAAIDRSGGSLFVFPATRSDRQYSGTTKFWRKVRVAAGLPSLRIHDLRHTFATNYAAEIGDPTVAQVLLGHKDIRTTSKYIQLSEVSLRRLHAEASEVIESRMLE